MRKHLSPNLFRQLAEWQTETAKMAVAALAARTSDTVLLRHVRIWFTLGLVGALCALLRWTTLTWPWWLLIVPVALAIALLNLLIGYLTRHLIRKVPEVRGARPFVVCGLFALAGVVMGSLPALRSTFISNSGICIVRVTDSLDRDDMFSNEDKTYSARPVFMVFPGNQDPETEDRHAAPVSIAETVWKAIYPHKGPVGGKFGSKGSVESGTFKLEYLPGIEDERIATNLNSLVNCFGCGWWRKTTLGYLICLNEAMPHDVSFQLSGQGLPKFVLLSSGFDKSCEFLKELTGRKINVTASNAIDVVQLVEPFPVRHRPKSEVLYFNSKTPASAEDVISRFAEYHGCRARHAGGETTLCDASPDEIESLAKEAADKIRREDRIPDYTMCSLSPAVLETMAPYLDDPDENFTYTLFNGFLAAGTRVDGDRLLKILEARPAHPNRRLAACLLARNGDDRALPYLQEYTRDETEFRDMITAIGWIHTRQGVDTQRKLLKNRSPAMGNYKMARLRIEQLPTGVAKEDALTLASLAVDYANIFHRPMHLKQTGIVLQFLPDGKNAACLLSRGYYCGPLAAGGETFIVKFQKFGDLWVLVSGEEGSSWIS